ncbi:DNA transposase THAP9 [Trichonephila inaurata madagascariensis]|uniref:DNA transposase THAP9 n=1 Tax=Trichonephila inaurata madagascariensis TaxID=2747483 RepID=A0A8X7BMN3_9ARAC|nr:DNA transposase THAP9 [Trichonephila inaurata madagascariensis]
MVHCCVPFCKSDSRRKDKNVSFHEFPSNISLRDVWRKNVSRLNFSVSDKSGSFVVCCKHFKETDYVSSRMKRILKRGTIPTVFLGDPSNMDPKENFSRTKELRTFHCLENKTYNPEILKLTPCKETIEEADVSFKEVEECPASNTPEVVTVTNDSSFSYSSSISEAELLLHFARFASFEKNKSDTPLNVEISNARLAFVAGYLVFVIEEHECISCLENITQVGSSPLFTSITAQDHRCLYYPSKCDGQFCNNGSTSTTWKKVYCT